MLPSQMGACTLPGAAVPRQSEESSQSFRSIDILHELSEEKSDHLSLSLFHHSLLVPAGYMGPVSRERHANRLSLGWAASPSSSGSVSPKRGIDKSPRHAMN